MWSKIKTFLFRNENPRQIVAKNSFWLAVSNGGGRLLRALIIIYAARVLGAGEWGVFSYALTLAGFLTIFIDFGLNSIVVREISKRGAEERPKILSTAFYLKLGLLALGTLMILFVAPKITTIPGVVPILPYIALIFIFDSIREFGFSFIRSMERMEWEAGLMLFTNLAIVTFGFAFLWMAPSLGTFTQAYMLGTGLGMGATLMLLSRRLGDFFLHFRPELIRPIFQAAWPFAVSGVLGVLMLNTDILILGWFRSATEVGFYSAGHRIIQVLYLVPAILALSSLPILSRWAGVDRGSFRKALEQLLGLALLLAWPLAIGGTMIAYSLIHFLYGASFLPGTPPFQFLLLTLVIDFPAVILANAIFTYNRQRNLVVYAAIGGGLNVVLDLLLIPPLGGMGCAIGTLIAQGASNLYLWRIAKQANEFEVWPHLRKILIATSGMAIVVLGLSAAGLHPLVIVGGAGLAYFALLAALKEPFVAELRLIFQPSRVEI